MRILLYLILSITSIGVGFWLVKKKQDDPKRRKTAILLLLIALVLMILSVLTWYLGRNRGNKSNFADGYIVAEGERTGNYEKLFYKSGDRYLIDIYGVRNALSLEVSVNDTQVITRTSKTQIEMAVGSGDYKINLNAIRDDENYLVPFLEDDRLYVDTEALFSTFGYSCSFDYNEVQDLVQLRIEKESGDPYETITLRKQNPSYPTVPLEIGTESDVPKEGTISKPGESGLPLVEQPKETKPISEEEFLRNGGTYPEEVQKILDERPEVATATEAKRPQVVERPKAESGTIPEEKLQQIWEEAKSNLKNVFQSGHPSTGNVPYTERTEDFIAFNPMNKAIYFDTISVQHHAEGRTFMETVIASEWSDLALNTSNEETKAFYNGIPVMVEAAVKETVGEAAGSRLYAFIKEHADQTKTGGYIATYDEAGNSVAVWSDGQVGDGIMSTEMDFESWQGQRTDDGLIFDVSREGEGIRIVVSRW